MSKKIAIIATIFVLVTVNSGFGAYLRNIPQKITQPNGEIVNCFASGDEFYNWLHDADGYTIIKNPDNGYYFYADNVNGALIPSRYIVGKVNPASVGLEKFLKKSFEEYSQKQAFFAKPYTDYMELSYAPKTGTINNIVIFIRFSDESEFNQSITTYDNMFNSAGTGYNSMYNYFREVSYYQLTVTSTFYPIPGTMIVSYQDAYPRNYYRVYDAVTNPVGYNGDTELRDREHILLKNAVNAVSSQIPTYLDVDGDNDGYVDNVCFMIYGSPEGWAELLWPHKWALYSQTAYIHSIRVWEYNFQLETYLDVGVLCHEMFHSLGAPDLYHYSYDGLTPVGSWDVMQSDLNPPQHMGAYMKYRYGTWISSIPEITASGMYNINSLISSSNNCYKIASPNSTTEYFVVEYRRELDSVFENSLPGTGLLVYRINTSKDGQGNANGPPDEVYIYRPNGTTTVNGNVNNANFSSNVGRTEINDYTNPSSFLSNGSHGGLNISEVGMVNGTISFRVTLPGDLAPPTLSSPLNGVTSQPTTITLVWNASSGATWYRLQVDDDPNFGSPSYDQGAIVTTSVEVPGLSDNTTFYWRAYAYNSSITSPWSSAWHFTTGGGSQLDHFEIAQISSPQTINTPFQITITAKDVGGGTVTYFGGTVTINDLTGTVSPTMSGTFINGIWTGNIAISQVYSNNQITVTGTGHTGTSNLFDVILGGGLSISVTNPYGNPASSARVEVYTDTTSYDDYSGYTDVNGMLKLPDVPDGRHTVLVYSSNDHFLFVLADVTVPGSLVLSAADLTPVEVYTKAKAGISPIAALVVFAPFRHSLGTVGYTASADGHGTFYVSNWAYSGVAAVCFDEPYHLVEFKKTISAPTSITFNPVTMPTGEVQMNLDNFEEITMFHWCGYSNWSYLVYVQNGDNMVYSAGTYSIYPRLRKYDVDNHLWYYNLDKGGLYYSYPIAEGSSQILQAGGVFSASTIPNKSTYDSGEVVSINNKISDSYENQITWVNGYVSDQISSELVSAKGTKDYLLFKSPEDSKTMPYRELWEGHGASINAGFYAAIYPAIRVLDPDDAVISEDSSYTVFRYHQFTLADPATEGTYNIHLSLDTGPHQGVITGSNYFTVGTAPPAPNLASPSDGAAGQPMTLTLVWNASTGATSYQLQVDDDSNFGSPFFDQAGITATSQQVSGLSNNTTYYWEVNASNASGTSPWSSVWHFTTGGGGLVHFTPVPSTGDARPVVVQNATINDLAIAAGDEIGVYDGSLCMGAASFSGSYPLQITVWMEVTLPGGTVLPGAKAGHSMIFKVWDMSAALELGATPTYTQGNGTFGEPLTVVNPLKANLLEHFEPVGSTGDARPVIVQSATIDNVPLVSGNEIGIYDGSLCVGAIKFLGSYPLTITVWMKVTLPDGTVLPGATAGNSMSFKMWEKSTDTELSAQPTYTQGNGTFGEPITVVNPLKAHTFVTQTIPIKQGKLNMISFNIEPPNLTVNMLLDDIATLLVAQDDDGKFYIPPYGVNTIGNVDLTNGYQVYITGSADDSVVNDGYPLVPQNYSQALNNTKLFMIGYPYQNAHPVTDVFASITSSAVVVQDDEGRFWIPMYGVNTIGNMQPGKGYQIYASQTVNFAYPALAGGLAKATAAVVELPEPTHFQFQRTGLPYGIVVTGSEKELAIGDEVGVFAGELCVGASVFAGDYPLVIAAWEGDDEHELTGFKAGETISLHVWNITEGKKVEAAGRFATSRESAFRGGPISVVSLEAVVQPAVIPTAFTLDQNYPNPFNPETKISYHLPEAGEVTLTVYNLEGKLIRRLESGHQEAGSYEVVWDGRDDRGEKVASGIYFYRLETGQYSAMKKLLLIK